MEGAFAQIERASGGRLGIAAVDADGRLLAGNRSDERFAFCSTFKMLLAGMMLDGHARGLWRLDEALPVGKGDLVPHAPVIAEKLEEGSVTIGEAARAVVTISDNAAANLLLRRAGGLDAFNLWLRAHGDSATRLDRWEPELNENAPGDPRDTTTPAAIAGTAAKLVFGELLPVVERERLRAWLIESPTGRDRIRAGLPDGWPAGDKTGTCGGPSYNDVAFLVPEGTDPGRGYILAVYLDRPTGGAADANGRIAEVARAFADTLR